MKIRHHHQKSRSRLLIAKIGVILTAASITGALTVNVPAFANTFDSSTNTIIRTQNPQDWQQVWQILALTGYVHLVYGTYMGRYGGMHTVAAWNIPVPRALQKISNNWGYSPYNPAFRSGLIQFERADHLLNRRGISRGRVTPEVLSALRAPIPKNRFPFQWIKVDKSTHPEHLQIWQVPPDPQGKGQWIYRTVVNTGVMHSTPDGSWPIYQRLAKTTMTGKFPIAVSPQQYHLLPASDRSIFHGYHVRWQHYTAPNVHFVNYFYDGRAIHFYPRKGYGWPQSAGCVEEPYKNARKVYALLHYGDIVSVMGHYENHKSNLVTPMTARKLRQKILLEFAHS